MVINIYSDIVNVFETTINISLTNKKKYQKWKIWILHSIS